MKIKLKKDIQLSSADNFSKLPYKKWLDLNNGKTVELDEVPELIKDKVDKISTKKGAK